MLTLKHAAVKINANVIHLKTELKEGKRWAPKLIRLPIPPSHNPSNVEFEMAGSAKRLLKFGLQHTAANTSLLARACMFGDVQPRHESYDERGVNMPLPDVTSHHDIEEHPQRVTFYSAGSRYLGLSPCWSVMLQLVCQWLVKIFHWQILPDATGADQRCNLRIWRGCCWRAPNSCVKIIIGRAKVVDRAVVRC